MDYLSLIFRWMHILPASIMFGGAVFVRYCLIPSSAGSSFDTNQEMRKSWMRLVSISTLLLLVSGLYNGITKIIAYKLTPDYHGLVLGKLLIGLAVFYLAAVLAGRSDRAVRMRQKETYWTNILVFLMFLLIMIGGYMKISSTDAVKKSVLKSETKTVAAFYSPK